MARGDDLLLYPGGAYESVKPPEARYQLQWKQRYGFVRLAAAAGYTVVPIASVGPDEYYDHAISSQALFHSAPVRLLMKAGSVTGGYAPGPNATASCGPAGRTATQTQDHLFCHWPADRSCTIQRRHTLDQ